MPTRHIKEINITVPGTFTYTYVPAPRREPSPSPSPAPSSPSDSFYLPRNNLRPTMIGDQIYFIPGPSPASLAQEMGFFEQLWRWLWS